MMSPRIRACVSTGAAALILAVLAAGCGRDPAGLEAPAILAGKGSPGGGPKVTGTEPTSAPRDTTLDVRVSGSGFDAGSEVNMALEGMVDPNKIRTNSTRFVTPSELVANITIAATAPLDLYDVIVTASTGKKGIGTEMFEVTPQIMDLGLFPGGDGAWAYDINEVGQIVGTANHADRSEQAMLWEVTAGGVTIHDLGTRQGGRFSAAWGMNDLGQIVGWSDGASGFRAVLWQPGGGTWTLTELGTLGGSGISSALDINNSGKVVGYASTASGESHAFLWGNGAMADLGTLGGRTSRAEGINAQGLVVGSAAVPPPTGPQTLHAVLWKIDQAGQVFTLDLGGLGGSDQRATGISDQDAAGRVQIVGYGTDTRERYHAIRWTVDVDAWRVASMVDLGRSLEAVGINDAGEAVGTDIAANRAVLWTPTNELRLLGSLHGNSNSSVHSSAQAINNAGNVVGSSEGRAVLWVRK